MASNPKGAFLAHHNYLEALDIIIDRYAGGSRFSRIVPRDRVYRAITTAISNLPAFTRLTQRQLDRRTRSIISAILKNGWTTELLLEVTGEVVDDELVGMANNWGSVQAYYACYHAFQAVLVAQGQARPDKHSKTQRSYCDFWVKRTLPLPPWSFGWNTGGPCNPPANHVFTQDINPWTQAGLENCWDLAGQALRKTRENRLLERAGQMRDRKQADLRKKWSESQAQQVATGRRPQLMPTFPRPRLTSAEKQDIELKTRPATLLDYLYRLRIRCNYEDASMFTDGPDSPNQSRDVHLALRHIVSATMLVHETWLLGLIGKDELLALMDDWSSGVTIQPGTLGVHARRVLFAAMNP